MGKLYSSSDVYEINNPAQPATSIIEAPEYKLAKILDSIVKPSISDNYMLASINHFIAKVKKVKIQSHKILLSFEVVSHFTVALLEETIPIKANYLLDRDY